MQTEARWHHGYLPPRERGSVARVTG